jgi:predicted  nucleic acid-binding Zn-ribbon protein
MKGYMQNQEKSKIFHEQRKYEQLRKSLGDTIDNQNENMKKIQQNILEETDDDEIKNLSSRLETIKKQIKELEDKREDYSKKEKKLKDKLEESSNNVAAVSAEV